ncbi:longevity assurance proteins LAG1/LAC1 [Punctularia strigosozonata HHB-11173 SS5]|uniref:longevity assurance proteins LAG1/LAC1 n=1 Tax=Punctularia strigosozonata (strain HHB-11173) TaxID=741275 RepID=UPI0004417BDA|nr:longevity assurance proteins LAG1/LAC1 [Punctularia strigosozonata HHB-11173 SS5]EIN10456.1 longevity assurance proteins LAG1/LAC1 [Punctularia strigosozonata HHB-11173 SS5]
MAAKRRGRALSKIETIEADPAHHLNGPFAPQTPLDMDSSVSDSPPNVSQTRNSSAERAAESTGLWSDIKTGRWIVRPASSFKLMLIPIVLYYNWEWIQSYLGTNHPNPFEPMLYISHRIPDSPEDDPRYHKGYMDLVFVAYHMIVWSFVRQFITLNICRPTARYFGLNKQSKIERFGEQAYAIVYFGFFGAWGYASPLYRIMGQLPTWWYNTKYFWIDYPHWDMKPELKRYYLMQAAYWCQQLLVMLLRLEKPRSDYAELVAHHFVTLWLIGWSYLINMTFIGNAVYMSMDIPDWFLAVSKLLNYLKLDHSKIVSFVVFMGMWSYFRLYLNFVMLWSVWFEFDLMPETSKRWYPEDGVWLVWWMKYQIFAPLLLLLCLNLFWYYYILRIAYRAVFAPPDQVTDDRSDDEDDDAEPETDEKKN